MSSAKIIGEIDFRPKKVFQPRVIRGEGGHTHTHRRVAAPHLLCTNIRVLIEEVKKAKYFDVIADTTPDKSHKEYITVIIR